MFKGGSRTATVSKMELFMTIFNAVVVSPRSTSEILFGGNISYLLRCFCFVSADFVEKEWQRLRNRYSRVKRELRENNISGTGTISLKNAK